MRSKAPTRADPGSVIVPGTEHPRAGAEAFEGQSQDRQAIADRVATYGLKVFCTDCGLMHRHRTIGGDRLRNVPSVCCGARMRPGRWKGWGEWRIGLRQEPESPPDGRIIRKGGQYYMRGFDS